MNIVLISEAAPTETYRHVATDASQGLTASKLIDTGSSPHPNRVKQALITVETYAVRVAFGGTTPTQGASGVGHSLEVNDSISLDSWDAISSFRFINETNGEAGVLQVTLGF